MNYEEMEAYEVLDELKKVVPQERRSDSPNKKAELRKRRKRLERALFSDPSGYGVEEEVVEYAVKVLKGRFPAGERYLIELGEHSGPECACEYATKVIKGRWRAAEHLIAMDAGVWHEYLSFLLKKDKKALVAACKSMDVFAMWYSENVAKGEWKPGEKALLNGKDWTSYYYAISIGRRWTPGEKNILAEGDPQTCAEYAQFVVKGRWPEAERFILKNLGVSLGYASSVIKGRWEQYEKAIINDPYMCYLYAKQVVKGRLPEHMHQAMVMHSFSDPSDESVKKYLGSKKYNKVA
jgi:hypothetical protein